MFKVKLFVILIAGLCFVNSVIQSTTYTCGQTTPLGVSDCLNQVTDSKNYCCYLSPVMPAVGTSNMCLSVPKVSFVNKITQSYGGVVYYITCSTAKIESPILQSCATPTDQSKSQCSVGSSFINSCCYFSGYTTSATPAAGCYWLNTKYFGTTTWAGLALDCFTLNINLPIGLIVLILSLLY